MEISIRGQQIVMILVDFNYSSGMDG